MKEFVLIFITLFTFTFGTMTAPTFAVGALQTNIQFDDGSNDEDIDPISNSLSNLVEEELHPPVMKAPPILVPFVMALASYPPHKMLSPQDSYKILIKPPSFLV